MIKKVIELKENIEYLEKRNLVKQYKKVKEFILNGKLDLVYFKKRKPRTSKIYQFRINKKYRAFGYFDINDNTVFRVIEINDHQD